ncbi:MAG TPA: class I SAM-dependent methyltransferase [Candidatus Acidoferrum sp.]
MSFLHKLGIGVGNTESIRREVSGPIHLTSRARTPGGSVPPAAGSTRAPVQLESNRLSNGLKELLWNLDGLERGALLDLGPAWQTTLSFFIERGFKVSSEDILRAWKAFLSEEERRLREDFAAGESLEMTPSARATRFLKDNLQYPRSSFDAVLLWDLLDYLEQALVKQVVVNITELLRPGGVVFAMFHSKRPEGFQRYRVLDSSTLQMVPTAIICPAQRVYQNREIQDLFGRYRTMKSFVGRDQLRETLFVK